MCVTYSIYHLVDFNCGATIIFTVTFHSCQGSSNSKRTKNIKKLTKSRDAAAKKNRYKKSRDIILRSHLENSCSIPFHNLSAELFHSAFALYTLIVPIDSRNTKIWAFPKVHDLHNYLLLVLNNFRVC